jgi:hypothetical protein
MKKQYTYKTVTYGFHVRKWHFKSKSFELLMPVPGGAEIAHAIARLVAGGLARTKEKGIDGLTRSAIDKKLSEVRP